MEYFSTILQTVWRPAQKNSWGVASTPLTGRSLYKLNRSALSISCPTCAGSEVDRKVGLESNPTFLSMIRSIADLAQDADPAGTAISKVILGTAAGAGRVPGSGSILSETGPWFS